MAEARPKTALTRRSKYSEHEIDAGLTALALVSGNTRRASRLLARSGQRMVAPTTLHRWFTNLYVDRYRELQKRALPELNQRLADAHDDLVVAYTELQQEAIEKARAELPNLKGLDASRVAKDAAIGAGINSEKSLLRRGQPTEIRETRDTSQLLRILHEKFSHAVTIAPGLLVEDEATESRSS